MAAPRQCRAATGRWASGFIFSLQGEGGAIKSFDNRGDAAQAIDNVRLTDRFYLGEPQIRGFDIRGVGPRVLRQYHRPMMATATR
jgi:outer membrane protein insertion porin family